VIKTLRIALAITAFALMSSSALAANRPYFDGNALLAECLTNGGWNKVTALRTS
jgi:hypothetical protein